LSFSIEYVNNLPEDIVFFIKEVKDIDTLKSLLPEDLKPNDIEKVELKDSHVYFHYLINSKTDLSIKERISKW